MQEQIDLLTNEMNRLKQKKEYIISAKSTNWDEQIAEYQKAITALKGL